MADGPGFPSDQREEEPWNPTTPPPLLPPPENCSELYERRRSNLTEAPRPLWALGESRFSSLGRACTQERDFRSLHSRPAETASREEEEVAQWENGKEKRSKVPGWVDKSLDHSGSQFPDDLPVRMN